MTFHVGQKVVCVDAGDWPLLTNGKVYVVLSINTPWLRVDVASNGPDDIRNGYHHTRFRPVVERKTSIEIFQRMLTPKKEHVNA